MTLCPTWCSWPQPHGTEDFCCLLSLLSSETPLEQAYRRAELEEEPLVHSTGLKRRMQDAVAALVKLPEDLRHDLVAIAAA